MKQLRKNLWMVVILMACSGIFFGIQYLLYHNTQEAGFLFFQDLVFLPVQVILITLLLDQILQRRKKQENLEKMHLLINEFYTEAGTELLHTLNTMLDDPDWWSSRFTVDGTWDDAKFRTADKSLMTYNVQLGDIQPHLEDACSVFKASKPIMLMLLNAPMMLEHDNFTQMLWAVYHLQDELSSRSTLLQLPHSDISHLKVDIQRAYKLLLQEWLSYMKQLKKEYPYLFSMAYRKNPFLDASVTIKE